MPTLNELGLDPANEEFEIYAQKLQSLKDSKEAAANKILHIRFLLDEYETSDNIFRDIETKKIGDEYSRLYIFEKEARRILYSIEKILFKDEETNPCQHLTSNS